MDKVLWLAVTDVVDLVDERLRFGHGEHCGWRKK